MSRFTDSANTSALSATVIRPFLLLELELSPYVYLWSGLGNLSWNGQTWVGVGTLGQISAIEETVSVEAVGATFSLSSIPSDLLSDVLNYEFQNKGASLYLGFMDENLAMLADPEKIFTGTIDVVNVIDGGDSCILKMNVENVLRGLLRPRNKKYTSQELKKKYPTDLGLDYVADLQDATINWGSLV